MSFSINVSGLVGKNLIDENSKEIGKVVSFIIDSSGQPQEVLVETPHGQLVKYNANLIKTNKEKVMLTSEVANNVESLMEQLPIIKKKRKILDRLVESKVIPSGIYESLCKEFDKILREMEKDAQTILEYIEEQVKIQDEQLKSLQLARAFLEIEHGVEAIEDEIYQQSIMAVLKQVKNVQQTKLNLLKTKEKVVQTLQEDEEKEEKSAESSEEKENQPEFPVETTDESESKEDKQALIVHITED